MTQPVTVIFALLVGSTNPLVGDPAGFEGHRTEPLFLDFRLDVPLELGTQVPVTLNFQALSFFGPQSDIRSLPN